MSLDLAGAQRQVPTGEQRPTGRAAGQPFELGSQLSDEWRVGQELFQKLEAVVLVSELAVSEQPALGGRLLV